MILLSILFAVFIFVLWILTKKQKKKAVDQFNSINRQTFNQ